MGKSVSVNNRLASRCVVIAALVGLSACTTASNSERLVEHPTKPKPKAITVEAVKETEAPDKPTSGQSTQISPTPSKTTLASSIKTPRLDQAAPRPSQSTVRESESVAATAEFNMEPERKLPPNTPVPGGIAVLTVGSTTTTKPVVTYEKASVYVTRRNVNWVAAVGIPLSTKPGTQKLTITHANHAPVNLLFDVVDTNYKTQSLTIKNKRKVNPNPNDQARIQRDWEVIKKAKATFSKNDLPNLELKWPLKGRISSEFGLRRIYNGQPRNPHSGLDIAAPTGTPIVAPSKGTVVETGDFFFNGQTVFVDHGHGLVTMYCHMSKIDVAVGTTVNLGDTLGLVGETGRVTGPHLHLGVLLNGQMVDPTLLLSD